MYMQTAQKNDDRRSIKMHQYAKEIKICVCFLSSLYLSVYVLDAVFSTSKETQNNRKMLSTNINQNKGKKVGKERRSYLNMETILDVPLYIDDSCRNYIFRMMQPLFTFQAIAFVSMFAEEKTNLSTEEKGFNDSTHTE